MTAVEPNKWLLVVYIALIYGRIQAVQGERIKQIYCLPEDVFFTKAIQPVKVVRFKNNIITQKILNYPSIASEHQCMSICKLNTNLNCLSIEYDYVNKNCTLQANNRFILKRRVRLMQSSNSSSRIDYYEKRPCSKNYTQETKFVAVVPNAVDCQDLYRRGWRLNGVYAVKAYDLKGYQIPVLCQMEIAGGGWTVVQQNLPERELIMNRKLVAYNTGMGDLLTNFWFGNEFLHNITSGNNNEVMFILTDANGDVSYPLYEGFSVGGIESEFQLSVGNYRYIGIGRILYNDDFKTHNGYKFSAKNEDNDNESSMKCAKDIAKAGFWYGGHNCYRVNINGIAEATDRTGIVFAEITGNGETVTPLKKTQMLVRRV